MVFTPVDGPKQRKQVRRASGVNPLSYMGVMPESPTNYVTFDKDPTTKDFKNWEIGDEWENRTTADVFKLVEKGRGVHGAEGYGTWIKIANGLGNLSSLKDDAGTVITGDATGSVSVKGGKNIETVATANTLTANLEQGTLTGQVLITNPTTGEAVWNRITPGAGVTVTNGDGTITLSTAAAAGDLTISADGGTTATSVAGTIKVQGTAGKVTATGNMADKVTLNIGSDVALKASVSGTFTTDSGNATPAAGIITMHGGQNIGTTAAGSTVTVNLDNTYQVAVAPASLELGTVDATQKLGSISIDALKVLLGLP